MRSLCLCKSHNVFRCDIVDTFCIFYNFIVWELCETWVVRCGYIKQVNLQCHQHDQRKVLFAINLEKLSMSDPIVNVKYAIILTLTSVVLPHLWKNILTWCMQRTNENQLHKINQVSFQSTILLISYKFGENFFK